MKHVSKVRDGLDGASIAEFVHLFHHGSELVLGGAQLLDETEEEVVVGLEVPLHARLVDGHVCDFSW